MRLYSGINASLVSRAAKLRHDSEHPRIPFNRPHLTGREQVHLADLAARGHLSGDGHFTKQCQTVLEEVTGAKRALLTTSGTHALELAALLLNIGPGDEVLIPSFTFVSTANAFVLRGATPIFADIRPDTQNLDVEACADLITRKTRAIVPVHYAGVGCEMDQIEQLSRQHDVAVVEDNALGLLGTYHGRPLGSFGKVAAQSFHETKNLSCGEGGAILINDIELGERAEILREKGTDRSKFFRGEVDKYTWVDIGSSYLPSDILAAFLFAQLEDRERIASVRADIWNRYLVGLRPWAADQGVQLPTVPSHCKSAHALFHLVMRTPEDRDHLIASLRRLNILSVFHYQPLHLSPMGLRFGGRVGQCPVSEYVAERIVRLPFFMDLDSGTQERIIEAVSSYPSAQ